MMDDNRRNLLDAAAMVSRRFEQIAGPVFFIGFIAAHQVFGINAAVKVLGIACIATGLFWSVKRLIPVGVEGRPASFVLRGSITLFIGIAMIAVGIAIFFNSSLAVCVLGWSAQTGC